MGPGIVSLPVASMKTFFTAWLSTSVAVTIRTSALLIMRFWYLVLNRLILDHPPESASIDLSLLERTSPVSWDNVVLYGEYVLDQQRIQV